MIKNILEYIRWSNLLIKFRINPLHWKISFGWSTSDDMHPGLIVSTYLEVGPLEITLYIDNGRW